jgi:RNA polymerase sigma-70 factor (ECF subfamily)
VDEVPMDQKSGLDASSGSPAMLDIRQIIEANYGSVYGYAYRLAGNPADAEDVTQQTFLIAHQKLHQVRDAEKADRWLFAVVRSCFLKSRRRKRPAPAANMELNVDEIPESLTDDSDVDAELLQNSLDELPEDSRMVLVMFYFEELSYKEIAAELDVPVGTVMSRIARAKGRLRHALCGKQANSNSENVQPAQPARNASTAVNE